MEWSRDTFSGKRTAAIQLSSILLGLLSFYMDSKLLFFTSVFAFMAIIANQMYGNRVGTGLSIRAGKRREHFFVNEDGCWELLFTNTGWPILNGELRVLFDQAVESAGAEETNTGLQEVIVPFSISKGEAKKLEIPYKTKKRGLAKIRHLEVHVPNLIGFGKIILEYRRLLAQEAVIYPNRLPVARAAEILSGKPGSQFASFSLFEDMLSPAGTRDYTYSDGFQRIHWKASARAGKLQTKLYDRVIEKGMIICLNVTDGFSISADFEALMESTADLAYFAYLRQIPISICLNIRHAGEVPFYYIPPGEGREQLQKIYEMLAVANANQATFPYDRMLSYLGRHLNLLPSVVHGGVLPKQGALILSGFEQKGARLLLLEASDGAAQLAEFRGPSERRILP